MVLEMSHGELLVGLPTLQTHHRMFGNALPPWDWLGWCLWCGDCHATMCVFLRFQGLQTAIDVLKGCVHLLWRQFMRLNLCENEVFRHGEQGLRHGIFLARGGSETQTAFWSSHGVGHLARALQHGQQEACEDSDGVLRGHKGPSRSAGPLLSPLGCGMVRCEGRIHALGRIHIGGIAYCCMGASAQ